MKLGACISAAVAAIWVNKMRSLLTTLGIIIGVAAVLAMVAIGDRAGENGKEVWNVSQLWV